MWPKRLIRIKDENNPFSKKKVIPKTMIAMIWKKNKARRRRRKEEITGALRRKDDLRLGDENALRIYAR